jgi:hypothetical protein
MVNAAAVLHENLSKLGTRDRQFATNLLAARRPSAKQIYWIAQLAQRAIAPTPSAPTAVDATGVRTLLLTARERGLKFPKIRFQSAAGEPIAVALAGERSRYVGSVMITDGGRYGSNKYYGRITDGGLVAAREMTPTVQAALVAMATNPAQAAAAHGHLTGNCCFCNRPLTTTESTTVGYGPICADKFDLPWG